MSELGKWADARHPDVAKAKARVESLPESETKHGKAVPFPYLDKDRLNVFSHQEINAAIEKAPIKTVYFKDLHANQHSVRPERVNQYIEHPNMVPAGRRSAEHGGKVDVPIVVKYKGLQTCWDGHHRATALWAKGKTSMPARFTDLDTKGN